MAIISGKTRRAVQLWLRPYGLTVDQYGALFVLMRTEGISQRELAEGLETDTTTAMVTCDGLEKKGLAKRSRNPTDRRANRLTITDKGKRLMEKVAPAIEQLSEPLAAVMTSEEIDRITPTLELIADTANAVLTGAAANRHTRRPR